MKLKGSNERNNRARAAKEADHAANFNALVAQGENPYKIFRQREVDAAARNQEKRMVADIQRKEQEVAERILRDDEYTQVQEETERQHRAYEKKYR